jgi:pyruvate,water dikinase
MSTHYLSFDDEDCHDDRVDFVGGKNASLGELMNADVRVPPGFAVTTDFYDEYLARTGLDEFIEERFDDDLSDIDAASEASEDIQQRIRNEPFPAELDAAIEDGWTQLVEDLAIDPDDLSVAVRSSATAEDLPDASFAGQQDTYLGIRTLSAVKDRIRDCIGSLFTARAISYREEHGFDHHDVKISVGVQRMVDARTSGVMFTLNPANGDRSKVRIEANWGLGEAVVSGSVTPDSFLVDKPVYKIVDRDIPTKRIATMATDDGVEEVELGEEKSTVPSLTADEIISLTDRAKTIETHFGEPQDIEWAIEEDGENKRIYILQSRPETSWNQSEDDENTEETSSDSAATTVLENISKSSDGRSS